MRRCEPADLGWPGSANPLAVGARLRLTTDRATYWRETRVSSGYLSSDPPRAHFGLPRNELPLNLLVVWSDGAARAVEPLRAGTLIALQRVAN